MLKICVIGLGYVGISNAILLAQENQVSAVDIDHNRIDLLNSRVSPIRDNYVEQFLASENLNLYCTTDLASALKDAQFAVVATPTNYDDTIHSFDTSSVEDVIQSISIISPSTCIIVKSTIPIGFIDKMKSKYNIDNIYFSPEFLREGQALYDNLYPSRIIVGGTAEVANDFANLLKSACKNKNAQIILTGTKEAEAIKLFSNSYLAMRVAYINEVDNFAMEKELDATDIINGMCADPRIGDGYNNPSFGYGGYCLPKDTKQLLANYDGVPQKMISAIVSSNDIRKNYISRYIMKKNPGAVGIYRLLMKSGTDNFREAAILDIAKRLLLEGVNVSIYEPQLNVDVLYGMPIISDLKSFLNNNDIIVANRITDEINAYQNKIISRDIFGVN